MSKLCLGCASFSNCYGNLSYIDCLNLITKALQLEITHFDTSPFYGMSESILGNIIKELGLETSSKIQVSSKIGRYGEDQFDFSGTKTKSSIINSLYLLNRNYLDIVFCHDIEFATNLDEIINETLPILAELKKEGKIKKIGISGYPLNVLDYVIERYEIDVVLTYCSYNLYYQGLEEYQTKWKQRGIEIIYGGITGMGLLTNLGPPAWHPANQILKNKCKQISTSLKKRGENITEYAFNFTILNNHIDSILIGPVNNTELIDYFNWIRFPISNDKINEIVNLLKIEENIWIEMGSEKNIELGIKKIERYSDGSDK